MEFTNEKTSLFLKNDYDIIQVAGIVVFVFRT